MGDTRFMGDKTVNIHKEVFLAKKDILVFQVQNEGIQNYVLLNSVCVCHDNIRDIRNCKSRKGDVQTSVKEAKGVDKALANNDFMANCQAYIPIYGLMNT